MKLIFPTSKLAGKTLCGLAWLDSGSFYNNPANQFLAFDPNNLIDYIVPVEEKFIGIFEITLPDIMDKMNGAVYLYIGAEPTVEDIKSRIKGVFFANTEGSEGIGFTEVILQHN